MILPKVKDGKPHGGAKSINDLASLGTRAIVTENEFKILPSLPRESGKDELQMPGHLISSYK